MDQSSPAILAFDFSADRLDVALQAPDGRWLIPHQAFANNFSGLSALKQEVLACLSQCPPGPRLAVVGESTGLYWWHTFHHLATDPALAAYEPELALLNPMHVKHFRQALPERDKDDPADTHLIARYFHNNGVKNFWDGDLRYLPLRQLSRAYCRPVHSLAAEKAFCLTLVYLLASEYKRLQAFSDLFGRTSQYVLSAYPDIAAIAAIPLPDLAAALNQVAHGKLKDATATAQTLHQVAADSFPLPDSLRPTVHTCLQLTLQTIAFFEQQQESYKQLLAAELAHYPEAALLLAEPGFGPVLVAGLLGEIGDTHRFISGQKYDRRIHRSRPRKYKDG